MNPPFSPEESDSSTIPIPASWQKRILQMSGWVVGVFLVVITSGLKGREHEVTGFRFQPFRFAAHASACFTPLSKACSMDAETLRIAGFVTAVGSEENWNIPLIP